MEKRTKFSYRIMGVKPSRDEYQKAEIDQSGYNAFVFLHYAILFYLIIRFFYMDELTDDYLFLYALYMAGGIYFHLRLNIKKVNRYDTYTIAEYKKRVRQLFFLSLRNGALLMLSLFILYRLTIGIYADQEIFYKILPATIGVSVGGFIGERSRINKPEKQE